MAQFRDAQGNIWAGDPSNPASMTLVKAAAPSGGALPGGGTIISDPFKPAKAAAETRNTQLEADLKQHQLDTVNQSPPPAGYRYKGDGTLEAVPGGPSDSADALDPATLTYYAQQVLAGAPMPAIGMGKQAAAARQAIMGEVARLGGAAGLTGADQARQIAHYKAGTGQITNLEKMAGSIGVNEQTALANGQQYLDRSAELPGQTRFAPVNAVSDWIQRKAGGTTISAADAAYNTFVNEYAKVVAGSPTGAGTLSDSARHEAMSTISSNASVDQKQHAFEQMKTDMANRMTAIHGGINDAYKSLTNQPGYEVPEGTQGLQVHPAQPTPSPFAQAGAAVGPGSAGAPPGPNGGGNPSLPPGWQGPSSGGPAAGLATGQTRFENLDNVNAVIDNGIRGGATNDQINQAIARVGGNAAPSDQLDAARTYLKNNPSFKGSFGNAQKEVAVSPFSQAAASPAGAFAVGAGNAVTAGQLGHIVEATGGNPNAVDATNALAHANPVPYFGGSMLGDTVGALGTGAALKGIAKTAPVSESVAALLSKPLAADTAYGAIQGAGNSDGSLGGTVAGALTGLGGSYLGSKIGRGLAGMRTPDGVEPLNRGEKAVMGAVNDTGQDSVIEALTNAGKLDAPATLADVSPQVNSLTGSAIRRSPNVAAMARDTLIPRGRGQIDRFGQAIERDLGPVANIPQTSADLTAQARAAAAPLYQAAYEALGASSVDLSDLATRPSMKAGLGRAYNIAQEEGRDPTALGFDLNPQGEVTLNRVPSFQTLDYVKRGLDDTLEPHRDPITGKLALNEATSAINNTKATLLSRIDAVNPDYKAARAAYAGPVQARDALARGQDAFSMNPDQLGMQVATQSPEHLAQMQTGYRSALMDAGNRLRYSSNPFDGTLGTPAAEQRLSALQYDPDSVANLLSQRDLEGQMAGSANRLIGNSMTAERAAADSQFDVNPMVEAGLHGAAAITTHGASIPGTAARVLGAGLKDRIALGLGNRAVQTADQIAPIALNTDPNATVANILAMSQQDKDYALAKAALAQGGSRPGGVTGTSVADALMQTYGY